MRCDQVIFHVQVLFQLLVLLCLGKELVQSGWTVYSATVQRGGWQSVATVAGGTPPATIPAMPLWSVKVSNVTVESGNETTQYGNETTQYGNETKKLYLYMVIWS